MRGLEETFADRLDFIHLDVDNEAAWQLARALGITGRNQYLLISAEGETVQRWVGPLYKTVMVDEIEGLLERLE